MARRAEISKQMLATLDERGLSILEDWISSLVYDRHLWPDQYLQHLMNVVGTIGKHGRDNAVDVVGAALGCLVECEL